jgi:hypothetical protein
VKETVKARRGVLPAQNQRAAVFRLRAPLNKPTGHADPSAAGIGRKRPDRSATNQPRIAAEEECCVPVVITWERTDIGPYHRRILLIVSGIL